VNFYSKQDNVQVNMESLQCISVAYIEVCISEMSEQSRSEWSG